MKYILSEQNIIKFFNALNNELPENIRLQLLKIKNSGLGEYYTFDTLHERDQYFISNCEKKLLETSLKNIYENSDDEKKNILLIEFINKHYYNERKLIKSLNFISVKSVLANFFNAYNIEYNYLELFCKIIYKTDKEIKNILITDFDKSNNEVIDMLKYFDRMTLKSDVKKYQLLDALRLYVMSNDVTIFTNYLISQNYFKK